MEFFGELVAIFVIALILFTFFFIFSFSWGKKSDLKIMDVQIKQEKLTLLNILKTPVEEKINGLPDNSNVADLLVLSYKNNNYDDFKRIVKSKEDLLFKNNGCRWTISIFDNKKLISSFGDFQINNLEDIPSYSGIQMANITIPINNTKYLLINYGDNLIEEGYGYC